MSQVNTSNGIAQQGAAKSKNARRRERKLQLALAPQAAMYKPEAAMYKPESVYRTPLPKASDGVGMYLKSIIDPSGFSAKCPSLIPVPSLMKRLTVLKTLTLDPLVRKIVWLPNLDRIMSIDATGVCSDIEFSEDLSEGFSKVRLVSGEVNLKSNQVSNGMNQLQGNVYGVFAHQLPNPAGMAPKDMASHAIGEGSYSTGTAQDGVTVRYTPVDDQEFRVPRNLYTQEGPITQVVKYIPLSTVLNATPIVYSDMPVAYGRVTVKVHLRTMSTGVTTLKIAIARGGVEHPWVHERSVASGQYVVDVEVVDDMPGPLSQISISADPMAVTMSASGSPQDSYVEIQTHGAAPPGNAPVVLLMIDNAGPGMTAQLTGTFNYEVVPDADLASNVKGTYRTTPMIEAAELQEALEAGLPNVYVGSKPQAFSFGTLRKVLGTVNDVRRFVDQASEVAGRFRN